MIEFHFFACSCPDLPTPFGEEAICSILCSCLLCQILIDHRDLCLFLGFLFIPLVYVPVFMPVPDCFDYSGLIVQFGIRYCGPSYFVLLSKNCSSYSGLPTALVEEWCWETCFYSIFCFCPLSRILIDHTDLGLFLGSLFCSIGLCACFYASTRLF